MFNKRIKERTIYIDEAFKEHSEENTDFKYEEKRTSINKYVTKITLKYHNIGKSTKIIPLYEKSCNKPIFYFVPCVNYNGNLWGDGKEPKGMDDLNKPWIYYNSKIKQNQQNHTQNKVTTATCANRKSATVNSLSVRFERYATAAVSFS